ncbi:hypothetical protein, partial [Endozoicomonas sp. ONNA1]|uniref:hypothetical protein n=1 Tax=Endozoicomonas sp. ONNA1 TaxID=2828740 RepID=UPI00214733D5
MQNSFREFPSNRLSREQLARQLSFILLEMQERFLRGKALRSLSFKVDKQKQNPQIAGDPAFHLYLSLLTETFNRHPTLWHTGSGERRHYQEDLSALFMKAADREDYGKEWYQQIRRILDGEKPVPVTPPPPAQETVRYHYEDDDEYEGWFELTTFRVMLGMGAMVGVFAASIVYQVISEHEAESQRQQSQQEEELKKQLGKKLNKPERKDPKGRDWQPGIEDKEEVKRIMEGFPEKVWKNVMIQAGLMSPLFCRMDLDDILMQLQLSALYSHLREARYIWTEEDEIQHKRQQEEFAKRHKKEQEEAAKRARTVTHTSSTTHQQDDWGG